MTDKPSAINIVWFSMIMLATVVAAYNGKMGEITSASFDSARAAVTLAIGLIGPMALWLGIMKVVEEGGLMRIIARAIRPVMVRLFPDVPSDHPAMSAMIMNMAANMLGLGNAATPMGIKAMHELDKLNTEKGTATNAMCLFLAINTSSVTLLPLGVINIRAGAGAANPSAILVPSMLATACSTVIAILIAKLLARKTAGASPAPLSKSGPGSSQPAGDTKKPDLVPPGWVGKGLVWLFILAFLGAIAGRIVRGNMPALFGPQFLTSLSNWLM
ncbi:MAG: spore maturation protein, partial [Chitinivibrionales bacterium]|nr:spore maturation protein [Chitinivibrionales bacterium]MBD3396334.1 spore maturation protein [Chitinivibrionales bacterium]